MRPIVANDVHFNDYAMQVFLCFFQFENARSSDTTISNVHVNKVLLVTFAIYYCAIIHNILNNLLHGHEHVYGHYWLIFGEKVD